MENDPAGPPPPIMENSIIITVFLDASASLGLGMSNTNYDLLKISIISQPIIGFTFQIYMLHSFLDASASLHLSVSLTI